MTIHYFYANPIQGCLPGNKKSHPFGWLFLKIMFYWKMSSLSFELTLMLSIFRSMV